MRSRVGFRLSRDSQHCTLKLSRDKQPSLSLNSAVWLDINNCKPVTRGTDEIDRDLYIISILTRRYEICAGSVSYRSNSGNVFYCIADHADNNKGPTRQRELDRTDHTNQASICPDRSRSSGNRSSVWGVKPFLAGNIMTILC